MSVFVTGVSSSARIAETTIDSEYCDCDGGLVAASRSKKSSSICLPYAGSNRIRFRGFDLRPVGHPEADGDYIGVRRQSRRSKSGGCATALRDHFSARV